MIESPKFVAISKTCIVNANSIAAIGYLDKEKSDPIKVKLFNEAEYRSISKDFEESVLAKLGVSHLVTTGEDGVTHFISHASAGKP